MLRQENVTNEYDKEVVKAKVIRRPYFTSMIGTMLEYYDASLYGFMAPLLTTLFLPEMNRVNALILAFSIFPLGIVSRALGAVILGKIGDKFGRKQALIFSITGTSIITGLIGCLPTYATIGVTAPILLGLLNIMLKFFVAGEHNGGAIFMLEHSRENKGFRSGLYCGFVVAGILFAALIVAIIGYLPDGYWRFPYFLGSLIAFFGLFIRMKVPESPEFKATNETNEVPMTLMEKIKRYRWSLIWSIGAAGFFSALYVIPTIFMNVFVPLVSDISTEKMLVVNTYTLVVYMLALPVSGILGDRWGYRKSMTIAALVAVLGTYPLLLLLDTNLLSYIISMKFCFALLAAWFIGPYHAWIQELYDVKSRYQLISLTYSIGSQLGGTTPALALWAWKCTGITQIPAIFIISWGIFGVASIFYGSRKIGK